MKPFIRINLNIFPFATFLFNSAASRLSRSSPSQYKMAKGGGDYNDGSGSGPRLSAEKCPENREKAANFLSRLVYWFANPLIFLGADRPLELNDIEQMYPGDEVSACNKRFDEVARQLC